MSSDARGTAFSENDCDADNVDESKSERKRERERRRRQDLASAFDELAAILALIDPDESSDSMSTRQKRRKKSAGDAAELDAGDNSGSTRLDLIGKSVDILRKLHKENMELKRLHERNGEGKDDKEVFVMVPTLTPVNNEHEGGLPNSPSQMMARATDTYPHPSYYAHPSASLGPAAMAYHQGPIPPPEYRGYYSNTPTAHMHRNYGLPPYQQGANWLGGGGGPYYQPPQPESQYPPPSQHYETAEPSTTVHSESGAG